MLLTAIILLALCLLTLRLFAPVLIDVRTEAQQVLADRLQHPIDMQSVELDWWGWGPVLRVQDLVIHKSGKKERLFGFQQARARVDLSRSLWQARLILSELHLEGGEAVITWPSVNESAQPVSAPDNLVRLGLNNLLHRIRGIERIEIALDRLWLQSSKNKGGLDKRELGRDFSLSLNESEGGSRQIKMGLSLNSEFGKRLSLSADITDGYFYLRGDELQLAAWPHYGELLRGAGTVELWGDWRDQQLDALQVRADLTGISWTDTGAVLPDFRLNMQGGWQDASWAWKVRIQNLTESEATLYAELAQQPNQRWRLRMDELELSAVRPWLTQLDSEYVQLLQKMQPSGVLRQLEFTWDAERNQSELSATVEDFRTLPWERIPGIQGLQARIQLMGTHGRLDIASQEAKLDWPLLSDPIQNLALHGPLRWQWKDPAWVIDTADFQLSNEDLKARINGGLRFSPQGIWLDAQLAYEQIDIAQIPSYLPAAIMKPKLIAWLEHALVAGEIPQGTTILRGWAKDFPFDQFENSNEGLFETQFQVSNMHFDYFPGWTGIQDLSATVRFRNRGFTVAANDGSLGGAQLLSASARIDDLSNAELQIHSELSGATTDMLQVVKQSPLREKVWTRLAGLQASGQNKLSLDLLIPIDEKDKPMQVDGAVNFTGGALQIPEHNLRFGDMQGTLRFDESSVSAQRLSLRFMESLARLVITPRKDQLDFELQGQFDSAALVRPYSEVLSTYLGGASKWNIVAQVPNEASRPLRLTLSSTLSGTEIQLSEPFGKQAEQSRPLQLDLTQNQDRWVLQISIEPDLSAAFELNQTHQGWTAQRGELRLNSGIAKLPERNERVLLAHLPSYELSLESSAGLSFFDRSELLISHLHIGPWRVTDARLQGHKTTDGYRWTVDGGDSSGQIFLPQQISTAEPVYLAFDTLRLHNAKASPLISDKATLPTIDPRQLPPLHLIVEQLFLDGQLLGRLNTVLEPVAAGWALRTFEFHSEQQRLSATGEWTLRDAQHWSEVQVKLYSEALGQTLALWNIPLQLERAKTALSLDLNWPGTPMSPAWAQLAGTLQIHIEEGLMHGVKPGFGRMVGLFNIASLARRLALNFSDLVEDGLAFDQINGSVRFASGQASTDDLLLQGPAVNIAIQGSVGLHDQTLQQTVVIMPQIASSLALAGAVAGGPAVGAAVLLAGQVLKPSLEQAVSFQYEVSGTIDYPVIQPISIAPEAAEPLSGGARK